MIGSDNVRPLATLTGYGTWNETCVSPSCAVTVSSAAATVVGRGSGRSGAAPAKWGGGGGRGGGGGGGGGAGGGAPPRADVRCRTERRVRVFPERRRVGFGLLARALVDARQQPATHFHRRLGAIDHVSAVELLTESDGVAGDQRQIDAVPVLPREILQRRPALQQRLLRVRRGGRHQTGGGLPQRRPDDIGDAQLALFLAFRAQAQDTRILVSIGGERVQRLVDFGLQARVDEFDAVDLLEHELLEPLVAQDRDAMARRERPPLRRGPLLLGDRDDAAAKRMGAADFDLRAAQRLDEAGARIEGVA